MAAPADHGGGELSQQSPCTLEMTSDSWKILLMYVAINLMSQSIDTPNHMCISLHGDYNS